MAETWRVVLASGEVLSVEAWTDADGVPWARHRTASGEDLVCSHTPREAVVRAVAYAYSGIVEILAPGEPTRAELAAQHADPARLRAEHAAALATARREGAEAMRRAAGQVCHDVYLEDPSAAVAVCIDAIRALPTDGEVS